MNISSRCEYGCRAVAELAIHEQSHQPITSTVIAEKRSIPEKYLVHILLQLKRAGVVRSVRGAQGGYLLARPAEAISLYDVITAIDGPVLEPLPVGGVGSAELASTFEELADGISEVLKGITVRAIADRSRKAEMYYI